MPPKNAPQCSIVRPATAGTVAAGVGVLLVRPGCRTVGRVPAMADDGGVVAATEIGGVVAAAGTGEAAGEWPAPACGCSRCGGSKDEQPVAAARTHATRQARTGADLPGRAEPDRCHGMACMLPCGDIDAV